MGNSKCRRNFLKSMDLDMISDEEIITLFQSYVSTRKDDKMILSKNEALKLLNDVCHQFMEEIDNEIKELQKSGEFNEEIEINYKRVVEIRKHGINHFIENLFEKIDVDKNHFVDLNEFSSWMKVFVREKFKNIDFIPESSPTTVSNNGSTSLSNNISNKEVMRKGLHGSVLLVSGRNDHLNHDNVKNLNSTILDEAENVKTYCGILQIGRRVKIPIDVRNQAGAIMNIEVFNENDPVTNNGSLGVEIFLGSRKISDLRHIHPGQKLTLTDIPIPPLSSIFTNNNNNNSITTTTDTTTTTTDTDTDTTTTTITTTNTTTIATTMPFESTSSVSSSHSMITTNNDNELSSDLYELHIHLIAGLNSPKINYAIKTSW